MSRVGARREREGTVPRATAVLRLAKPARHAGYAPGAGTLARRRLAASPPWRGAVHARARMRGVDPGVRLDYTVVRGGVRCGCPGTAERRMRTGRSVGAELAGNRTARRPCMTSNAHGSGWQSPPVR